MSIFTKDPQAVLDYKFDWKALANNNGLSNWLGSAETISSSVVTVDSGITKVTDTITDTSTSVTVWLSAGTAGQAYKVTCRIVTNQGRTDERTIVIKVTDL